MLRIIWSVLEYILNTFKNNLYTSLYQSILSLSLLFMH